MTNEQLRRARENARAFAFNDGRIHQFLFERNPPPYVIESACGKQAYSSILDDGELWTDEAATCLECLVMTEDDRVNRELAEAISGLIQNAMTLPSFTSQFVVEADETDDEDEADDEEAGVEDGDPDQTRSDEGV